MKTIPKNKNNRARWLSALILIALAAGMVVFIITEVNNGNRFTVVKLNTKESANNISKGFVYYYFNADSLYGQALMAEKGDLLWLDDNPYYYTDLEEDSLYVDKNSDSLVYINDKLNTVCIESEKDLLPWFRQMKAADILAIKTICINTKIPPGYFPYLEKIAKANPHVAIKYLEEPGTIKEKPGSDIEKLISLFSPKLAVIALTQKQLGLLSGWKDIELLYLKITEDRDSSIPTASDSGKLSSSEQEKPFAVTQILTALPALKQCILTCNDLYDLNKDFFIHNPQIERLTVMPVKDVSFLQSLPQLKELNIIFDTLDIAGISNNCKNLHVLTLEGENHSGLSSICSLKNLTWLGLPSNTSQAEFNSIVLKQKGLQVLEIHGDDSLTDFIPLLQLHQLKSLIIEDTVTDAKTLPALTQLRYLSLPDKSFTDSLNIRALQKALPGCIIVPNSGACLGSGWLLLLIPLVPLFMLLKQLYTKRFPASFQNNKS